LVACWSARLLACSRASSLWCFPSRMNNGGNDENISIVICRFRIHSMLIPRLGSTTISLEFSSTKISKDPLSRLRARLST
jgi:hypothetical protein